MTTLILDRVKETTTTSGTGTLSLLGAVLGCQSFVGSIGTGNTTYYCIEDTLTGDWEVGIGTVTSGTPNTLSRTTVLSSSNAGALVSLAATNTKNVFVTSPASQLPLLSLANTFTSSVSAPGLNAGSTGITSSGGLTVSAGTSALQAVTASTGVFSSTLSTSALTSTGAATIGNTTTAGATYISSSGSSVPIVLGIPSGEPTFICMQVAGSNVGFVQSTPTNAFAVVNGAATAALFYIAQGGPATFSSTVAVSAGAFSVGNSVAIGLYADGTNLALRLQNTTGTMYFQTSSGSATMGTMSATGNLTMVGNITAYSDLRRKTDIKKLENVSVKLSRFKHGGFSYLDTVTGQRKIGVGAQDVAPFFPESVDMSEDGQLSVAYGQLALAALVEVVKEQLAVNKKLEARIDELKGKY